MSSPTLPQEPDWLTALSTNPAYQYAENRPWAMPPHRTTSNCIGNDYVLHHPKLHFRFYWHTHTLTLHGAVLFTHDCEGPPRGAHGASVATVYDEILAYPVWRTNRQAFTASLTINYKAMAPLNIWLPFMSQIDRVQGRKVYMVGKIYDGQDNNKVYSTGTGLWIESPYLSVINNAHPDAASKHSKL